MLARKTIKLYRHLLWFWGLALMVTSCTKKSGNKPEEQIVQELCRHIQQDRQMMIVDTNQTELIWSDGAMLELGISFPPGLQALITNPTHQHPIGTFVSDIEARRKTDWISAYIDTRHQTDGHVAIHTIDNRITAVVASIYVEYLNYRYPDALILIKGEFEPILFIVSNRVQASVMPVKF